MRDTHKYAYYTVGIRKGSELHRRLLAEAQELGQRHVPLVIKLKLQESLPQSSPCKGDALPSVPVQEEIDLSNASAALDSWED